MNEPIKYKSAFLEIGLFLFWVTVVYFVKFSQLFDFDFTIVGWSIISLYAILRVKPGVFILSGLIHSILYLFYIIGIYFTGQQEDSDYGKSLAISFVIVAYVLGVLTGTTRFNKSKFIDAVTSSKMIYFVYILIVIWVVFIYTESGLVGGSVVSSYGGLNYITTSDLLAMSALAIIGSNRTSYKESLIFALITLIALILLGSRISIVCFIICYLVSAKNINIRAKFAIAFSFLAILIFMINSINKADDELFYRFNTLYELDGDLSVIGRTEMVSSYLNNMYENPVCIIVACPPIAGNYVHNIISIHQYFGLITFLLIFLLYVISIIKYLRRKDAEIAGLLAYVFVLTLIARSWASLVFPVALAIIIYISFSRDPRHHVIREND